MLALTPKFCATLCLTQFGKHIWQKSTKGVRRMTERIKEQIEAVRQSGETNMLDTRMVQWIANRENYFELVIYLEEHREEYVNYLFTGEAPEAE